MSTCRLLALVGLGVGVLVAAPGEAQEGGVTDDPVATYDVRIKGSDIQIAKP